jgi:proteic killer suppression protein
MAILSFRDDATADLYHGRNTSRVRHFPNTILKVALRSPPANRLEALKSDLSGFYSIRVNDQWRIIFRWDSGANDVSLVDYH